MRRHRGTAEQAELDNRWQELGRGPTEVNFSLVFSAAGGSRPAAPVAGTPSGVEEVGAFENGLEEAGIGR